MSRKQRLPTDGGQSLTQNPFANLDNAGLPPGPPESAVEHSKQPAAAPRKNRGRVDIIRQTAHRGGKTVTVVTGFVGIGLPEKDCYVNVLRDAMAADKLDKCGIYFGTTGGQIYASSDEGDNWTAIASNLPGVLSIEVQTLA